MVGLTKLKPLLLGMSIQHPRAQIRAHEGGVFVEQSTNESEEQTLTTGAQHGYTHSDVVIQNDGEGNLTNEKSEWQNRNKLTATDNGKLTYEGSLSHETAVGQTNVNGTSRSDSVIDALGVKASTGDDLSLDGSNAKVELSRTPQTNRKV